MQVLIDNNLPPALARALNELSDAHEGVPVTHLREKFDATTADTDWIDALAAEGGWIVISQDRLRKSRLEREALRRSGLVFFLLEKSWSNHTFWEKSQNLVRWWPAILDQADRVVDGAAFLVPWQFSGKGKFKQA